MKSPLFTPSHPGAALAAALLALLLTGAGCKKRAAIPPPPPPGAYAPNTYPPAGYPPRPTPPGPQQPWRPAPAGPSAPAGPPTVPPQLPAPGVATADPLNRLNIPFMRQRAQAVLRQLVNALPANQKQMVQAIPLVVDDEVGEVNAFAACINGKSLMAISDGLLEIQAQMARARAMDERFGTKKFDAYTTFIAQNQRPKRAVVRPNPSFFPPQLDADPNKVVRQHQLFDEQLAFVLGHELAHHYLGHTGCVGRSGRLSPQDVGRALSNAVPAFNQPLELASDASGTRNVLDAGRMQPGYKWTETGAILTLRFFLALRKQTPAEALLFGFQSTHPHPAFRLPIVQQTAAAWRSSGGNPAVFPFPIPGLTG